MFPMKTIDSLERTLDRGFITPRDLQNMLPLTDGVKSFVTQSRKTIREILDACDHRLFIVVGPCSIHDPEAAIEYANRLKKLADDLSDTLYLVMRMYFEKPRTAVGWKGFINDPYLDGTCRIDEGLIAARRLLIEVAQLGLPTATEMLDPIVAQYLDDLIVWTAIGARTTESQIHRTIA